MDVAHPHGKIGSLSGSPFGTLIKCVGGQVEWAGATGNQKCPELRVGHCLQKSTCRQRTSSTSTRAREVGQGVTRKGVEFRIRQPTDFRVICTVVLLIQLHGNPHN